MLFFDQKSYLRFLYSKQDSEDGIGLPGAMSTAFNFQPGGGRNGNWSRSDSMNSRDTGSDKIIGSSNEEDDEEANVEIFRLQEQVITRLERLEKSSLETDTVEVPQIKYLLYFSNKYNCISVVLVTRNRYRGSATTTYLTSVCVLVIKYSNLIYFFCYFFLFDEKLILFFCAAHWFYFIFIFLELHLQFELY